jgi:hypothetical protein
MGLIRVMYWRGFGVPVDTLDASQSIDPEEEEDEEPG